MHSAPRPSLRPCYDTAGVTYDPSLLENHNRRVLILPAMVTSPYDRNILCKNKIDLKQ